MVVLLESTKLTNLKISNVSSQGGPNKPFPDGSSDGDMVGSNAAISVEVAHVSDFDPNGDYVVEAYFDGEDRDTISKVFKDGKSAIDLGEKLLININDPLYDPKKIAKKYDMEYFKG